LLCRSLRLGPLLPALFFTCVELLLEFADVILKTRVRVTLSLELFLDSVDLKSFNVTGVEPILLEFRGSGANRVASNVLFVW